jgi:hypothetical protein
LASLIFLDFDDVLAINNCYGGYDAVSPGPKPADLFEKLFHPPAVALLLHVICVHDPQIVITTSWLRFFERASMEQLLIRTGMAAVARGLHSKWEAPADRLMTRLGQIDRWLAANHRGESYVVLDDWTSGTGLSASRHDLDERVVFCDEGVGLHNGHWPQITKALSTPWGPASFLERN